MNPLSLVVRTTCDFFAWFMIIFGVNVVVHGYMTPGGGFQGGAIIATFAVFFLVAYGGRKMLAWVNEKVYDLFDEIGLVLFFLLAFWGLPTSFFFNFFAKPFTESSVTAIIPGAGTIALMSIAVGFEVSGAISLIILTMYKGIRIFRTESQELETGYER